MGLLEGFAETKTSLISGSGGVKNFIGFVGE